jgi:CheY-like chemotaxis protein
MSVLLVARHHSNIAKLGPRRGKPHRAEEEARSGECGHMSTEDELDFTKPPPKPASPPSPEKVASAKKEASTGGPELAKSGFYVAMARHASGGRVAPRTGDRHTIFVVEDDADLLKLVGEVMAKAGFLTRFARKPPRDQRRLQRDAASRPGAARRVPAGRRRIPDPRAHPRTTKLAKLPVIMMTGKSEVTDVARGLTLGADGYVTKPFKISALVSASRRCSGLDVAGGQRHQVHATSSAERHVDAVNTHGGRARRARRGSSAG